MVRHNLAYRHENGDVEGFSAFAFSASAAEQSCVNKIRNKVSTLGHEFDDARIIKSKKGLTAAEQKDIEQDWKTYRGVGEGPDPSSGMTGFFG